jgi:hypothetical protein
MEVLILLLVGIVLILIFKSTTKKQNQSYLTKEPIKKATQNKDNSLYQSSQKQRGQKPTKKNNYYQKIWKKGKDGEKAFQVFLEKIKIPFIFADQEPNTKYSGFKRPDFILGYKDNANKLTLAFEVKNKQTYPDKYGNQCHKLEIEELDGLENFSRDMSMPVYFAFKDGYDWLFISLEGFLEFSFGYKNELYIQLHFFERGVKSRNDFDNFINKHKAL